MTSQHLERIDTVTFMNSLPPVTLELIKSIQAMNIEPIVYGSQGVSLYIGQFKEFGDIDLLVDKQWVNERWQNLIAKMSEIGFVLVDEHEHEFSNPAGTTIAFAGSDILIRDGITKSVNDAVESFELDTILVRTLKPEVFLRAYEFSALDGYRMANRNKKDNVVIGLLRDYLAKTKGQL